VGFRRRDAEARTECSEQIAVGAEYGSSSLHVFGPHPFLDHYGIGVFWRGQSVSNLVLQAIDATGRLGLAEHFDVIIIGTGGA
jgi:hypothetical protein